MPILCLVLSFAVKLFQTVCHGDLAIMSLQNGTSELPGELFLHRVWRKKCFRILTYLFIIFSTKLQ